MADQVYLALTHCAVNKVNVIVFCDNYIANRFFGFDDVFLVSD